MALDLNTFSAKELDSLINQAKKRRTALKKRKPVTAVRKKITAAASAEGYTIAELFGSRSPAAAPSAAAAAGRKPRKAGKKARKAGVRKGRKLGKVAPKYRNPAKPSETWSGRGKQPRWMAAETAKGKKPDDFLIRK